MFLLHVRSALVAIVTLPVGVLIAFLPCTRSGIGSNIMSLGGIAIAIGAMVDAAIVMIENAHKHLERRPPGQPRAEILIEAAIEVGPALFFSLLVITVSFLPIFTLEAQEGRLFKPLAWTKTFAMAAAALLSVTLVPALMMLFVRGRIVPEARNPVNRVLIWLYRPMIAAVLRAKVLTVVLALVVAGRHACGRRANWQRSSCPPRTRARCSTCRRRCPGCRSPRRPSCCRRRTRSSSRFPRSRRCSARRAVPRPRPIRRRSRCSRPSSTSSRRSEWRPGMTIDKLDRRDGPGVAVPRRRNAWTMPIKARIDMLATGIRTPVGVKVLGQRPGRDRTARARRSRPRCKSVPGTAGAFAERITGGYYLDIVPDRARLARYGVMIERRAADRGIALGGETDHDHGRRPRALRASTCAIRATCAPTRRRIAREVLVPVEGGAWCRSARSPRSA